MDQEFNIFLMMCGVQ